jgi:hypothetical protein
MKVYTEKGLIDLEKLHVRDRVEWHDNARVIITHWTDESGAEVRRDVWASVLRGHETQLTGNLNGE